MGFWTLFEVASMPILQVLLMCSLGAFMATDYLNLLPVDARRSLNKIVFMVFTPSLMFANLAQTVTLQDIISWWFMVVNVGITFLIGGILGWLAAKLLKPKPHLEGLIISMCASGNLGNIMLIIVPAICKQDGNPFGDSCSTVGLSYVSFSMALGGFYIWTYSYHLIRSSAAKYKETLAVEESLKEPNKDLEANEKSHLLDGTIEHVTKAPTIEAKKEAKIWEQLLGLLHKILEELLAPPTIAAILGFIFGAVTWLRNLIIGDNAPLRVIQDSIKLLGDGTIPCITLILGGNLTQGFRKARLKPVIIIAVICVRYILLPIAGIGVVKAASHLGFLPSDPLYHFVLMLQFTVPPAMNIGTMTQLFDVAQEECSVLFLWTYLVAALALTVWSTVFMWILS
ncbi:protein PIN-LIKES 7 [Olea europaea var. sylvestris]|uniref:protein PIN-LIKES 7 n=1 Tax=Olea europaea var. sylvestris TaxID=158386 RepID=UPI000C1D7042|nr:protein PIN-LIKES 7 [Olea europaea var. sylvestris]XP_022855040.1 protein PIN-LIKES 7 [Olea europaea var. sylvestris]XP_022855041.1 protein PIN-LIKES 7 [Olea europaea var. sylvestris]